jgi:hypothetical protein
MSKKISNDTIGNRTRDLPACSAVPQPTAPPCTPAMRLIGCKFGDNLRFLPSIDKVVTLLPSMTFENLRFECDD